MGTHWKTAVRLWACLLMFLLSGCGEEPIRVPLTTAEEAAIYTAIFKYAGGSDRYAIDPDTNQGYWRRGEALDCDSFESILLRDMPTIVPEIIPAFCALNRTSRPINPEVITLLALDVTTKDSLTATHFLKLSSIQTDSQKTQALVFVQLQDGDVFRGTYLLLTHEDGLWNVRYDWETYIS